nr:hypothetical protein [Methanobrevibacter arboriphilus]
MPDWKLDKNKNCKKCTQWEKGGVSEADMVSPAEGYGNICSCADCSSDDEYLHILFRAITTLEDIRQDNFSSGYYENEPVCVLLANICPLYEEKQ